MNIDEVAKKILADNKELFTNLAKAEEKELRTILKEDKTAEFWKYKADQYKRELTKLQEEYRERGWFCPGVSMEEYEDFLDLTANPHRDDDKSHVKCIVSIDPNTTTRTYNS